MINPPAVLSAPLSRRNMHLMGVAYMTLNGGLRAMTRILDSIESNPALGQDHLPPGFLIFMRASIVTLTDFEDRGIMRAVRPYNYEAMEILPLGDLPIILNECMKLLSRDLFFNVYYRNKLNDFADITYLRLPDAEYHLLAVEVCDRLFNMLASVQWRFREAINLVEMYQEWHALQLNVQLVLNGNFGDDDSDSGNESDEEGQTLSLAASIPPFNYHRLLISQYTEICLLPPVAR